MQVLREKLSWKRTYSQNDSKDVDWDGQILVALGKELQMAEQVWCQYWFPLHVSRIQDLLEVVNFI